MENMGHLILLPQVSEETRAGGCAQSRAVPTSRGVSPVQPGTRAVVAELLWSSRGGHRGLGLPGVKARV